VDAKAKSSQGYGKEHAGEGTGIAEYGKPVMSAKSGIHAEK
jgi:hypothetical protein